MTRFARALRLAARRCARRPALAGAVVLILGLGVGVTTAVFSLVQPLLWRPLPVADLHRLLVAWEAEPGRGAARELSFPYFLDWRAQSRSFEEMSAFGTSTWSHQLRTAAGVETVPYGAVSATFFDTLRARPALGRTFLPHEDEPGAERVAVLSHAFWQRHFGGDPAAVGRTLHLSGEPFTVIGVMPDGFDLPRGAQLWASVGRELAEFHRREGHPPGFQRGYGVLYVLGRLKDGVSAESARLELDAIARRLSVADGLSRQGREARVAPLVDHYLGASTRRALEALGIASLLVLLLACANVGVLLLVEAMARQGELAVRRALGAGIGRIVSQQLAESGILALGGGLLGTALAWGVVRAASAFGPADLPALREASLDGWRLGLALVLTGATAVLVSAAPAWFGARLSILSLLKAGGPGADPRGWRLGRVLVASEVALSVVLLVGCGLMVRSLDRLLRVDLGFVPEGALSFSVARPGGGEERPFQRRLLERLAALPGVEAAGAVNNRPLQHGHIGMDAWVTVEGSPLDLASVRANAVSVNWQSVTPDYFRAVGTRLIEGRGFGERDTPEAPKVAVVSRSLARRAWPGGSAIGKRIHTWGARAELKDGVVVNVEWVTVVGVVQDARYRGLQDPRLDVYLAAGQAPGGQPYYMARVKGDPRALVPAVREQVRALDREAAVEELTTMTGLVDRALAPWRFTSALLGAFALVALALTTTGLFAVLHRFVSQRRREIAVRMALGADPRRVRRFVLARGLQVVGAGLALGVVLAVALGGSLSALLYEVRAGDPWSVLAGCAVLFLVAMAACLAAARRAARVDPQVALRSE
jgi:putative ABC transport system permease protein